MKQGKKREDQVRLTLAPGQEFVLNMMGDAQGADADCSFFGYVLQCKGQAFVAEFHLGEEESLHLAPGQMVAIKCFINKMPHAFSARVIEASEQMEEREQENERTKEKKTIVTRRIIAEFEVASVLEQSQRREFFRLPVNIVVYYRRIDSPEGVRGASRAIEESVREKDPRRMIQADALDEDQSFQKFKTVDLSAGGLRGKLTVRPTLGDRMEMRVMLGQNDILPVIASVARVQDLLAPGQFDVSFQFENMHEAVRERIMRFVFAEQLKMVRRERVMRGMV